MPSWSAMVMSQPFLPMMEELDPAAAHKVFQDIGGVQNDDKLDELPFALDYLPLAVSLMA